MNTNPSRVRTACVASYAAHKNDRSGFVKALSHQLGVPLAGLADDIVATLRGGGIWTPIAGSLGGPPGQDQTLNYAWTVKDRDRISYASTPSV